VRANCIAQWNGTGWAPLGSGATGGLNPCVHTLCVYDGELIAGGTFLIAGDEVSAYWARWGCPYSPGDLNCDGRTNNFDITPFVLALTSSPPEYAEYYAEFPDCHLFNADVNGDGQVNNFDISPFVQLLVRQ
jgi:hypothetical protein